MQHPSQPGYTPSRYDNRLDTPTNAIKCGKCRRYHATIEDVKICCGVATRPALSVVRPSPAPAPAAPQAPRPVAHTPAPTPPTPPVWPLKTPLAMIREMRDGRYAVQHDDLDPLKFIRISRPKQGRKRNAIVIQTQHSDDYRDRIIIWPSGRWSILDKRVDEYLIYVAADPVTAAIRYGMELGRCSRCGRELTDERSRYYAIGPECEQHWPDLINRIEDEYGEYQPGKKRGD